MHYRSSLERKRDRYYAKTHDPHDRFVNQDENVSRTKGEKRRRCKLRFLRPLPSRGVAAISVLQPLIFGQASPDSKQP